MTMPETVWKWKPNDPLMAIASRQVLYKTTKSSLELCLDSFSCTLLLQFALHVFVLSSLFLSLKCSSPRFPFLTFIFFLFSIVNPSPLSLSSALYRDETLVISERCSRKWEEGSARDFGAFRGGHIGRRTCNTHTHTHTHTYTRGGYILNRVFACCCLLQLLVSYITISCFLISPPSPSSYLHNNFVLISQCISWPPVCVSTI